MNRPVVRSSQRLRAHKQLMKFVDHATLDVDLAEAVAGDRELTPAEQEAVRRLREQRGQRFFCDLLFALTHQYFPQEQARWLWDEILKHKWRMSEKLGRNVGLQVAALDFLANVENLIDDPVIMSQPAMAVVAEVALRDGLTGLYDHQAFSEKLKSEMRRFRRYGNHISVVMMDVDHFKRYNDRCGHQAGDRLLQELSKILTAEMREVDLAARYGGEEFSLMLPRTDFAEAMLIAERIRAHAQRRFCRDNPVTVSLGVATCPQHATSVADLVRAADRALYQAKAAGRNRVVGCGDEVEPVSPRGTA